MQRRKSVEWRDLNSKFSFHSFALYIKGKQQPKRAATPAEVVGSNPTQSISSCSGNTGTGSRLFKKFSPHDLRCICMTLSLFFISSNLKTMVEVSNSQMEAFHPSIPTLQNG